MEKLNKEMLVGNLQRMGAFEVRVADPSSGFCHSIPERHPLAIYPQCRSVIVFAIGKPTWANNTALAIHNTIPTRQDPEKLPLLHRLLHTPGYTTVSIGDLLWERVWLTGTNLLRKFGYEVMVGPIQEKLCAYEAGIGVYGRSGLIIHPKLGSRLSIGVFLTNAEIEPDTKLKRYAPCKHCHACVMACPAQAFTDEGCYPDNWSADVCMARRKELADEGFYCHECLRACQAGEIDDSEFLMIKSVRSVQDACFLKNPAMQVSPSAY